MKTIGLIGGMSCESTAIYYRLINEGVRARLGGLHSAKILMHSFDFAEIQALQNTAGWDEAGDWLAESGHRLEKAGADCVLICTNLMHKVEPAVSAAVTVPVLHIADATGTALKRAGVAHPLLLATRPVMEQDFYTARLAERFGIAAMVPDEADREAVNRIIFDELVRGLVTEVSKARFLEVIGKAERAGADGVVLACTEIGLLIGQNDMALPVFDTAVLHAEAAVAFALAERVSIAA